MTYASDVLGVSRPTLSRVLNGHAGVSPDLAIRLEKAGWSNAEHWLRLPNYGGMSKMNSVKKAWGDYRKLKRAFSKGIKKASEITVSK